MHKAKLPFPLQVLLITIWIVPKVCSCQTLHCEMYRPHIIVKAIIGKSTFSCFVRFMSIIVRAPPRTVKQVRFFLGMTGYYRQYIRGYAQIAQPLTELTKKRSRFAWNDQCQAAFVSLKQALT